MSKGEGGGRNKCLIYVAAFIVFQSAIIAVFALTVMKIKSPKVRFGSVAVSEFAANNSTGPSFAMKLTTEFTVKNTNFGHFKYDDSTVAILYEGVQVGSAVIPKARARARKTRRTTIVIDISSVGLPSSTNLGNDMNSGVLRLTSHARLSGKVHLMKVIKKKKSGEMSCSMAVNLMSRSVQDLNCK